MGIEIGGTKLQAVLGSSNGEIQQRWRFTVDRVEGAAGIRRQIESAIHLAKERYQFGTVGVGFGGPVDWRTGQICCSHHIEGWSDFQFGKWLHSLTGQPVIVDNDANVAALGEALRGAGRGFDPVFYVTLGSGVGGGAVVNGRIYHGAKPGESEIGHIRLDRDGTIVESRCSGWSVDGRIRASAQKYPKGELAKLTQGVESGEARFLARAMEAGDEEAEKILRETAEDLGFALSHVAHLFHPEIIVLGGGLSMIGEPLRSRVAEALDRFVMTAFTPRPVVTIASLGEDVVPVGALLMASGNR